MGKDSLAGGNLFPYFAGINSHNIKEYFPTIVGLPELTDILTQDHSILYIRQIEALTPRLRKSPCMYSCSFGLISRSLLQQR